MSTGEGGGPGDRQGQDDGERRRTPPPRRRTPPPRSSRGGSVEERKRAKPAGGGSLFSRLFGRQGLDKALEERFNPYDYKSTRPQLRWLFLGLLIFIAAGGYALLQDLQFRGQVSDWRSEGQTALPAKKDDVDRALIIASLNGDPIAICQAERDATSATPTPEITDPEATPAEATGPTTSIVLQGCDAMDRVFASAAENGFDCSTPQELTSAIADSGTISQSCKKLVDDSRKYDGLVTNSNIATLLVILALLGTAFPFSSFLHQSSRNLRTMKSDGQKHSPGVAVIRFIVPFVNLYKPLQIFMELFKASDPKVPDGDSTAWQKRGSIHPLAIVYGLLWPAFLVFNQFTVSQIWSSGHRNNLADMYKVTAQLAGADVIVIALGIVTGLTALALSRRQDARAALRGTVTVTPPRPRDPLEKALEEGEIGGGKASEERDNRRDRDRRGKR